MSKQKTFLPVLALVMSSILWGINAPVVKVGLESIPATIFISVKFLIIALLLLPFALKTWKPIKRRELGVMTIASVISFTGGALALNLGLHDAPSINSAVIGLLGPLLLCLLSVEFLKERMSLKTFIGVLIAFAGSAIIIGKPWEASLTGQTVLLGNVLILASVLFDVIATVIAKPVVSKMSSYQATFLYILPGVLPLAALSFTQLHGWSIHDVTRSGWYAMLYGIVGMLMANLFFVYGLQYKKAYSIGIYQYLQSVSIVVASWLILAERPSLKFAVGAVLVVVGAYWAESKSPRKWLLHHFNR
jgi:O-acetylserine/cysteine efflux transporter